MKIVPLTSIILILGLGIFGYTLCSDQAATMNLAVGASGGSSDSEPTGLRQTNKDLEEKAVVRESATKKVAKAQAELDRMTEINNQFYRTYTKNSDEFSILAVDPRWKFVVFNAGKDSGIVAGTTTPMLVKRGSEPVITLRVVSVSGGQVIAEYDADQLPKGLQLEVGDKVFRQKPLGS